MQDPINIIPIGTTREWHGVIITMTEDGWRAEAKQNMHRRCQNWDYSKPWIYMITIDTQHHSIPPMPAVSSPSEPAVSSPSESTALAPGSEHVLSALGCEQSSYRLPAWLEREYSKSGHPHLFGELSPELDANGKPFIQLNPFGKAVEKEILGIPHYYPQLRIIEHIVMPNHIHFIVRVMERLPEGKPLGFIINKFKSWVNRRFKEIVLGLPASTCMEISQPSSEGNGGTSRAVKLLQPRAENTKLGHGFKNPKHGLVFEAGFHDRILFREGQLDAMRAYVLDNPRRLWEVVHNHKYFEHIENWAITMPLLPYGGTKNAGRWWEYIPVPLAQGQKFQSVLGLLAPLAMTADTMTVTFSAIGNRSLLKVPERMQIQCSWKMQEAEIEELIEEVLEACKHGVIPVSPCLSPGEKAVARAVMDAGYPLIALFPQGIPPQTEEYKPYGQFFDACAQGRLLILSPWEFKPGVQKVARWQCLMLNDMAAQLSVRKGR